MHQVIQKYCIVTLIATLLAACGYQKALVPADPRGFIVRKEQNVDSGRTPFQYVWRNPESVLRDEIIASRKYSLYISPISTELLNFEEKDSKLESYAKDTAIYLRERIKLEIEKMQDKNFVINLVEDRSKADAAIDLAITEIGLGSPVLYTGALLVPFPGTASAVDGMHSPSLSIEGRFIDVRSNSSLTEIADRRIPKIRVVDLNKATSKISPLRDICNDWAKIIARGSQTNLAEEKLKGEGSFTLIPW